MTEVGDVYQFISAEMLTALFPIHQIVKLKTTITVKLVFFFFFFFLNQKYCLYLFLNMPPIPTLTAAADHSI